MTTNQPLIFKHIHDWLIDKIYEFRNYKTLDKYLILAIDIILLDLSWIEELKEEYDGTTNENGEIVTIKARS